MSKKLPSERIGDFLRTLTEDHQVIVPIKTREAIYFAPYSDGLELCLDRYAVLSPKEYLFPSSEKLFSFQYRKSEQDVSRTEVVIKSEATSQKTVIFGARPCDVSGFVTFDKVYAGNGYRDPFYEARRKAVIFIALTCDNPANTCFCTSVGGSPAATQGIDVLLTKIGDDYLVESFTPAGETLIKNPIFKYADYLDEKKATEVKQSAIEKVTKAFSTEKVAEKLMEMFSSDYWRKATAKCLSCGICTYVCPTCYCFNITDEGTGGAGDRIRSWDSCMFFLFTLEASGHNPRSEKFERFRNRINHKYSYFVTQYGFISCVGCGRCIRHCPVSIDIREVVREASRFCRDFVNANDSS